MVRMWRLGSMTVGRLLRPRWLVRHGAVIALVVLFGALARWQYARALGGNTLSWGYALQWPLFAGFVVAVWVRAVRDELRAGGQPAAPRQPPIRRQTPEAAHGADGAGGVDGPDGADDPDLAAYNRYLAWLNEHPDRRPDEYLG